jgi:molybdopterin-guanine dinucleotide biosynthesis protein A
MLPALSDYRQRDMHRLNAILAKAETLFVDFPDDAPFANLNRPEQYEEALRKLDKSSR